MKDQPFTASSVDTFVAKTKEYLGPAIKVDVEFVQQVRIEPTGKRRYFKKKYREAVPRAE